MSFESPHSTRPRRGPSALTVTFLALAGLAGGFAAWVEWAGDSPPSRPASGVILPIPAPPSAQPLKSPAAGPAAAIRPAPGADSPAAAMPDEAAVAAGVGGPSTPEAPAPSPPEAEPQPPSPPPFVPRAQPRPRAGEDIRVAAAPPGLGAAPAAVMPAPDPALIERTGVGPLPRVSPDGRKPWRVYARPFDTGDRRPRIAVIVTNLGLSGAATEAAIQRLPGAVTLAFAPYAKELEAWITLARTAGHEVLLGLPMEPVDVPVRNLGPHTLLTSLDNAQNRARLHWMLGRVAGYVGVVNQMGSRFTASPLHVRPVLWELKERGLLFVDSRSSLRSVAARMATELGLPRVINNRFIDAEASRNAIDGRLAELERIARRSGYAVGIGQPFPVTLDRLALWTRTVEDRGFALSPVSAVADRQPD